MPPRPSDRGSHHRYGVEDAWLRHRAVRRIPCRAFVFQMMQTLIEFPPRQKPASFSLEQVLAKLETGMTSA